MLYPILDTALLAKYSIPLPDALAVCLDHALPFVQIRHKAPFDRPFCSLLESCARLAENSLSTVILNDRADYARLFGFGLHVGQDDLPAHHARQILGPEPILGLSTHNLPQLEAAAFAPVNYLALGPIFPTTSKANPDPVVGLASLAAWRPVSPFPLIAIGGITLDNAALVLDAGADFVSLISALWTPPYTLGSFGDNIDEWRNRLNRPL